MALKHPFCQCDDPGPGPGPGPDPGPIELDGDVTGPSDDTTVEAIQGVPVEAGTPSDKDVLAFDAGDGKAKWQPPAIPAAAQVPFDPTGTGLAAEDVQAAIVEASGILAAVEIPLPASGSPDTTVYTAPTSKLVEIFAIKVLLVEPMTGAGAVTLTMGATAGGDGYVIAQPITSASTGLVAGHTKSLATLGARFPANAGYVAALAPGDEIVARLTASGAVSGGKILVVVEGRVTP